MINTWLLTLPAAVYAAYLLIVIVRVETGREASRAETYALGQRNYRPLLVFYTLAATMIGPTFSLGVVSSVYRYGYWYCLIFSLAMVQFFIGSWLFAGRIQEHRQSRTVGDLIGRYYGRIAHLFTGVATVAQMILGVAVLCLGGALVLNGVWGVPVQVGTIVVGVIVAAYTVRGGMPAVLRTDKWQFYWMVAALAVGLVAAAFLIGDSSVSAADAAGLPGSTLTPSAIVGIAVAFLLGEWFSPVYANRALMAANPPAARIGFLAAGGFGVVWFLLLGLIGLSARIHLGGGLDADGVLIEVIRRAFGGGLVGSLFLGLVAAGILGLVMSTLDSALNAGSVSLSRDVLGKIVELSEDEELRYGRIGVFIIAFAGVIVTFFMSNLVQILIRAYEVWVPTVVVPLAYCLLRGRVNQARSGTVGIVSGIVGYAAAATGLVPLIPPILAGLFANAIAFTLMEARRPPRPEPGV